MQQDAGPAGTSFAVEEDKEVAGNVECDGEENGAILVAGVDATNEEIISANLMLKGTYRQNMS